MNEARTENKRPITCSACQLVVGWRDTFREILVTMLKGPAAIPGVPCIALLILCVFMEKSDIKEVAIKFFESQLWQFGGWLCCGLACAAFVFCYKVTIKAKDDEIKALKAAKTPSYPVPPRQTEMNLNT